MSQDPHNGVLYSLVKAFAVECERNRTQYASSTKFRSSAVPPLS
jgi:hypothetical protein